MPVVERYRTPIPGQISPISPLSPITLSPTTPTSYMEEQQKNYLKKSESTPSLDASTCSSNSSSGSSITQVGTPSTPSSPTRTVRPAPITASVTVPVRMRTTSVTAEPPTPGIRTDAESLADNFNLSFAHLLSAISTSDEEEILVSPATPAGFKPTNIQPAPPGSKAAPQQQTRELPKPVHRPPRGPLPKRPTNPLPRPPRDPLPKPPTNARSERKPTGLTIHTTENRKDERKPRRPTRSLPKLPFVASEARGSERSSPSSAWESSSHSSHSSSPSPSPSILCTPNQSPEKEPRSVTPAMEREQEMVRESKTDRELRRWSQIGPKGQIAPVLEPMPDVEPSAPPEPARHESELHPEPDPQPEPQQQAEPPLQLEPESESQQETEPEPQASKPKQEPEPEMGPRHESEPKPKSELKQESERQQAPEPKQEPMPKQEKKPELEPEANQPEPLQASEPKQEPAPQEQPSPDPQPEPQPEVDARPQPPHPPASPPPAYAPPNAKLPPITVNPYIVPSVTLQEPSPASPSNHAISTSAVVNRPGRQAVVRHAPTTCRLPSSNKYRKEPPKPQGNSTDAGVSLRPKTPSSPKQPAPTTLKPKTEDKRSVRVEMTDVDSFLLHWDAPELDPQPAWLASARGYVLEGQRLIIDIHEATPKEERKWLLRLAIECYLPMRQRYIDVMHVLRLSMPQLRLGEALKCNPPAPVSGMKRREFKREGSDPAPQDPMQLPRIVLPNPWRNTYRLLHNVAPTGQEPLWAPNGVVIDLTKAGDAEGAKGGIKLDPDTSPEAKSTTMNTMLLHALRRLTGSATIPPPDVQRAMSGCKARRLSFHPEKVSISMVGQYGGILDLSMPPPRGATSVPAWHQPVRVYLTAGAEFIYEFVDTTPDWRLEEIQQVVHDHIGAHLEAWSDIRRILGAFAPTDARLARLFVTPPPLKRGYARRSFVARVTRAPVNGVSCSDPRPESQLPQLQKRCKGIYILEYPEEAGIKPAALDCTGPGEPRVLIHPDAKHVALMVAWLFSIVTAVFEG